MAARRTGLNCLNDRKRETTGENRDILVITNANGFAGFDGIENHQQPEHDGRCLQGDWGERQEGTVLAALS